MATLQKTRSFGYRENGVVYTPTELANFVAKKVINLWSNDVLRRSSDKQSILRNIKIIDPACGEGELLLASARALQESFRDDLTKPSDVLYGVDIDSQAILRSSEHLGSSSSRNFLISNALVPENRNLTRPGWDGIKQVFNAGNGFDILIANPPWGADTSSYKDKLSNANFELLKGQYDTSDLFVELALSIVKPGGYFAFIIPDSLFGLERRDLRKLLIENTEIKFIGRLGEKIFSGINRACVVLICKKSEPKLNNKVRCVRLNPTIRKQILSGELSFELADEQLGHYVQQKRFSRSPDFLFDIDTREEEREVIDKLADCPATLADYVHSSRGVELSKTGRVFKCSACGFWSPVPAVKHSRCSHCHAEVDSSKAETATIISKKRFKGSKPILVGESVQRYSITSRYWIAVDNKGINYKSISLYHEPKILVRKTGVGITATIDYSRAFTNQVVYIFRQRADLSEPVPIEFILAVMNSRAMYYFLLKKYGETEWRSHPYLTQTQILGLPIADLSTSEAKKIQTAVVALLKPYLEKQEALPQSVDAEVEYLIALLFGLTKTDYDVIYKTLSDTQGLIPVKTLASVSVEDIFMLVRQKKYGA